jgi:hypothetical protein
MESRSKSARILVIGILVIASSLLLFIPVIPGDAIYEGVGIAQGERLIHQGGKPYVIEGGKLYLLRRQTWHALVLVTRVKTFDYVSNTTEIENLKQKFPELQNGRFWN